MSAVPDVKDVPQSQLRDRVKPDRILVSGAGAHLGQILEVARATGLPVWVPAELAAQGYVDGVSVLEPSAAPGPGTLWITGSTDAGGHFTWTPRMAEGDRFAAQGLSPKHPAILNDFLPRRVPLVVCGFPGTGNGIVTSIAEALMGDRAAPDPTPVLAYANAFAADYEAILREKVNALGDALGLPERSYATHIENEASCALTSDAQSLILFGLPLRNYLNERIHKTHEPFGDKLRRLVQAGSRVVLVARHPLDSLVSIANKFANHGLDVFNDRQLLRTICRTLVAYYDSFDDAPKDAVTLIRYEDLYSDFEGAVARIAAGLDIPADADLARSLRDRLLDKPIGHAGHFWAPGSGKWTTHLPLAAFHVATVGRMPQIFQRLDYPIPARSDLAPVPEPIPISTADRRSQAGVAAALCHIMSDREWKQLLVAPPGPLEDVRAMSMGGLYCICADESVLDAANKIVQTSDLEDFVMAGLEMPHPRLPPVPARKIVRKLLARLLSLRTKPQRPVAPAEPAAPAPTVALARAPRRGAKWPTEDYLDVRRVLLTREDMGAWGSADLAPFVTEMMNAEAISFFRHAFGYLYGSGVKGDYHEYGCFSARTFRLALSEVHKWQMNDMRLYAFDSFCGLPPPKDSPELASWQEGAMSMSVDEFKATVSELGFGLDRVSIVQGYYSDSLTPTLQQSLLAEGRRIAFCNVDCDLRESAEEVFRFVEPLVGDGTLVYLDDYFVGYGGRIDRGVAGAFWEFLERGQWKHERFRDVGFWGKSFILYR